VTFKYLRDPLFAACFTLYWAHRWAARLGYSTTFLRSYLNDLICIPFWIPIMLWAMRVTGLRKHDQPPDTIEIVIPLLLWAAVFEVLLPSQSAWRVPTVADPGDVLSYCIGALGSTLFWRWYYQTGTPSDDCREELP